MEHEKLKSIQQWQEGLQEEERKIEGDIRIMQPSQADRGSMTFGQVVTRSSQVVNTVSMSCIDRFSASSWEKIKIPKPKHGERIELVLKHLHSAYMQLCRFEFEVNENESWDIVVTDAKFEEIRRKWSDENGSVCVILFNQKKAEIPLPVNHTTADAARAQERYKAEERKQRKARRDALSRGSLDSAGTTSSGASTGSTAPSFEQGNNLANNQSGQQAYA